ncbi:Bro-N domain-containing protein [Pseudomonas citronellolis]|uniref:BRO-N domain-containing protein n=1 Tax=Pseudomonas citronellolis TaxID=53408 RepID=UPI00248EBE08|nr:Bro-N domain-containing protein [Pseudomonas citronellolis]
MQAAQVIPFRFETREVRTLLIDDQPWFVAADVCQALAVRNNRDALSRLDDDEKGVATTDTLGGTQAVGIINESGLYSLILTSRKAEAKRFKKWVTAEVLPAIRKHGRYEDADGRMATLVGQTIGTDGFHMLGSLIKGKVSSLPVPVQRRAAAKIWSQTHAAFGVRSAADIPAEQLDAARNFIAAYNVLEGEYIEGRKVGGIYLDDYETHHLYLLMSRFAIMSEHRGSMLAAARALDSKPLWTIFGQLDEGRSSFAKLDQRRAELYAIYSKGGLRGGYAMTA